MMTTLAKLVSGLVMSVVLRMAVADGASCEYGPWEFGPCNPITLLKYGERRLLPGSDPECPPEVTDAIDCVVTDAVNAKPVQVSPQNAVNVKPVQVSPQTAVNFKPVVVSPQGIFTPAETPSPSPPVYLLPTSNAQTATPKQPRKQAHCGPGVWLRTKGVRGRHYKMLALVYKRTAVTKCEELCLKDNKCTSFDTITISVATMCFGNPGPGPLVKKADFSHWEYRVNCNSSAGKAFVFHYLGSYYVESDSHCTTNQVNNLQECLSFCAENSTCVAGLYGDGSCCLVSNVDDARLIKVVANGSDLFEKRQLSPPAKPPSGRRTDSCNAIEFGTEVVYPAWKNDQICWSGKAKRECVYNYDRDLLKSSKAGNLTDQLLTKGSYEECLLLCTQMADCYEADYLHTDSLCKINVEKRARAWDDIQLSIRPDKKRWSYYTKDTCFAPVTRAATMRAAGQRLVSTLGTLLLMLGVQTLF